MKNPQKQIEFVQDYITGQTIPLSGPEENRQALERYLVESKGYDKQDIEVDEPLIVEAGGETYRSRIDLVVRVGKQRALVIKCAAGSLGSREREILAAARLAQNPPVPFAVVSDGKTATLLDALTGRCLGEGLDAIFSKEEAKERMKIPAADPLPGERRMKEALIFRTYDTMNVHVPPGPRPE